MADEKDRDREIEETAQQDARDVPDVAPIEVISYGR